MPDTAVVSFVTAVGVDIRMVMMESGLDSRDITLLIQPQAIQGRQSILLQV